MLIKIETSGIQVRKGKLLARADLYPAPADKTYAKQYFLNDLGVWQLNPALCCFFVIPEDIRASDIIDYLASAFSPDTWVTLDEYLSRPNNGKYVNAILKTVPKYSYAKIKTTDIPGLVNDVKRRLTIPPIAIDDKGKIVPVDPGTITVGEACGNYTSTIAANYTAFNLAASTGTGTIETIKIQFSASGTATGVVVGTFFLVSGTTFERRDTHSIGNVTKGSEQTFGGITDFDISIDDVLAEKNADSSIEREVTGFGGIKRYDGDAMTGGPQFDFGSTLADDGIALNGTGTESGVTEKTGSDSGSGADAMSSTLGAITTSDSGSGADALGLMLAAMIQNDSGSGVDNSRDRGLGASEIAAGLDSLSSLIATLTGSDSGSGIDVLSALLAAVAVSDAGAGIEEVLSLVVEIINELTSSDSGSGEESSLLAVVYTSSDAGTASETSLLRGTITASRISQFLKSRKLDNFFSRIKEEFPSRPEQNGGGR